MIGIDIYSIRSLKTCIQPRTLMFKSNHTIVAHPKRWI